MDPVNSGSDWPNCRRQDSQGRSFWQLDFANEVQLLVSEFALTKNTKALHRLLRLLQFGATTPIQTSMKEDYFGAFLESHTCHLRAILDYSRRHEEALKEVLGNQAVSESIQSIWESFAQQPDADSARLYASMSHRYAISELSKAYETVENKLEEYVKDLEQIEKN